MAVRTGGSMWVEGEATVWIRGEWKEGKVEEKEGAAV